MKPFYVVLLMGAAAVGGGLVVRYSEHPVEITMSPPAPPAVIAPPAQSVPVRSAPSESRAAASDAPAKPAKQSALSPAEPDPSTPEPRLIASAAPPTPAQSAASWPEPNRATLREGMLITVRIGQALSSNLNSPGDVFSGTLEKPVIADGFVIAERGAEVRGEVVESKSRGPGQGVAELAIRLREISASDGQRVHLVSAPWTKQGTASGRNTGNVYDVPLTRGGAAVIRPGTSMTFRLDETVVLTEKHESR